MFFSFVSSRQLSTLATISCSSRIWPRTRASVEKPVLPAPLLRQAELDEQHLGELLRRADRELAPGELVDLGLELCDLLRHPLADLGEALGVDLEADLLERGEDLDQRHLDLLQQALDPELAEALALAGREAVDEAGVDRRVAGGLPLLGGKRELALVGAAGRGGEAGVGGELVQVVDAAGGIDQVGGDHRVVGEVEPAGPGGGEQPAPRRARRGP